MNIQMKKVYEPNGKERVRFAANDYSGIQKWLGAVKASKDYKI